MAGSADPERYLSVDDVRLELGFRPAAFEQLLEGLDASFDDLVRKAIGDESDRLESETFADTRFEITTATATVYSSDAAAGSDLLVPDRPLDSLVSIELVDEDEQLEPTDVRVRETHLELKDSAPIDDWSGEISLEYEYGHDGMPGELRDALIRLVRSKLQRIKADGVESDSLPSGQSVSYRPPEDVVTQAQKTARKYRPDSYGSGAMVI